MDDERVTLHVASLAREAMDLLIDAVEQTTPENWSQPSNLEGWSLRDLVGHATGSAAKIVTLVEGGEVWGRSEPADWAQRTQPHVFVSWASGCRCPARRRPRRVEDLSGG